MRPTTTILDSSKAEILQKLQQEDVQFLRLQFSDILGNSKNVEVPKTRFAEALATEVCFDGSSIEGFTRVEESDMLLAPDLETFLIYPPLTNGDTQSGKVARLICDVLLPDGTPFLGDPRAVLKRQLERAAALGFEPWFGTESEFFLFEQGANGQATTVSHDKAGYFDLAPLDKGERIRREIVNVLVKLGFEIEAAHHEVASGQHEIDFRHAPALQTADRIATFKFVVKRIALEHRLLASFLPKPRAGLSGNGMHCHFSLLQDQKNLFQADEHSTHNEHGVNGTNDTSNTGDETHGLSQIARYFIAGLLEHAPALCAITNPLVNSYKRLVAGFEAPTNVAWSTGNRSALVRIPANRGLRTRVELRSPDPSCNPYLAFAVILAAGLDGIRQELEPPPAIQRNIFQMTVREKRHHRIRELPNNLSQALSELEKDAVLSEALGEHVLGHFLQAKRAEWQAYNEAVHDWELERYLHLI